MSAEPVTYCGTLRLTWKLKWQMYISWKTCLYSPSISKKLRSLSRMALLWAPPSGNIYRFKTHIYAYEESCTLVMSQTKAEARPVVAAHQYYQGCLPRLLCRCTRQIKLTRIDRRDHQRCIRPPARPSLCCCRPSVSATLLENMRHYSHHHDGTSTCWQGRSQGVAQQAHAPFLKFSFTIA